MGGKVFTLWVPVRVSSKQKAKVMDVVTSPDVTSKAISSATQSASSAPKAATSSKSSFAPANVKKEEGSKRRVSYFFDCAF